MSSATLSDFMNINQFPDYDIVYCDPPWEQRMVRFFQTQMKKQTGKTADNEIGAILAKLASLCSTEKPVFIEYSVKNCDRVINHMEAAGHKHFKTVNGLQTNNKPYVIMAFNTSVDIGDGVKGFDAVTKAVKLTGAKTVVDPFAGIGKTAEAAIKAGATYHGYELNPARYERLSKVVGSMGR